MSPSAHIHARPAPAAEDARAHNRVWVGGATAARRRRSQQPAEIWGGAHPHRPQARTCTQSRATPRPWPRAQAHITHDRIAGGQRARAGATAALASQRTQHATTERAHTGAPGRSFRRTTTQHLDPRPRARTHSAWRRRANIQHGLCAWECVVRGVGGGVLRGGRSKAASAYRTHRSRPAFGGAPAPLRSTPTPDAARAPRTALHPGEWRRGRAGQTRTATPHSSGTARPHLASGKRRSAPPRRPRPASRRRQPGPPPPLTTEAHHHHHHHHPARAPAGHPYLRCPGPGPETSEQLLELQVGRTHSHADAAAK